jgi:site-specific recombinase XerD
MTDHTLLGPWIRRFLIEHLRRDRNLRQNTQRSYRDCLALLLPFLASKVEQPIDRLTTEHLSAEHVGLFLRYLERQRIAQSPLVISGWLPSIALAHFIGMRCPEQLAWCGEMRRIPFKKSIQATMPYLEKHELDALLATPDRGTPQGRRDHRLLLFLYNSGARADEAAQLVVADLNLSPPGSVRILGKGNKIRHCPLWSVTIDALKMAVNDRGPTERVFLNRCGRPLTRFGIHTMVERYARKVAARMPSFASKQVGPHTIRHTTAVHLLRAGVDINTIRAWLGHVSLDTTNIYAEIDLEMKAYALAKCDVGEGDEKHKPWREDRTLMTFLRSL